MRVVQVSSFLMKSLLLILLIKINNLAQGYSGVRLELIEALISLYNHKVYPCIPCQRLSRCFG